MKLLVYILIMYACCLYSCRNATMQQEKQTTAEALDSLIGRQIQFQNHNIYHINGKDTVITDTQSNPYKIIVYAVPNRCNDCTLRLGEWNLKLKELNQLQLSPKIVFIIQQVDYTTFEHYTHVMKPDFPFVYDSTGMFLSANKLPHNTMYHTFLVDSADRIVLMGSPLGNTTMWDLYKSTIARLVENGGTLPPENSDDK